MKNYWIGIDISKASYDVHITDGQIGRNGKFDNTMSGHKKAHTWLKKRGAESGHVCLEATGRYGEDVALYLHNLGYTVSVINPRVIHHYAKVQMQRNKTDLLDAKLLATYCERENPHIWTPPPPEVSQLRELTRHLDDLLVSRTSAINRLKAGTQLDAVADSLRLQIDYYDSQILLMRQSILDHIELHPTLKKPFLLLISIIGIGETTAAILLAELPHLDNITSPKQLAAYAGLTPRQLQSGTAFRRAGVLKHGNKHVRKALYFPALSALRHNPHLKAFFERLQAKGKPKMSIVAAIMRKLVHLVYAILKKGVPFDPNYGAKPVLALDV